MNRRRLQEGANLALVSVLLLWGCWLLGQVRTKPDYLADRLGPGTLACEWTALDDPLLATLGLSHEGDHSWTDRSRAYAVFRAPAMPEGGVLEMSVVASLTRLEARVRGVEGKMRFKGAATRRLELPPTEEAMVRVMELDSRALVPPQGGDRRWLGSAVARIRLCHEGDMPAP